MFHYLPYIITTISLYPYEGMVWNAKRSTLQHQCDNWWLQSRRVYSMGMPFSKSIDLIVYTRIQLWCDRWIPYHNQWQGSNSRLSILKFWSGSGMSSMFPPIWIPYSWHRPQECRYINANPNDYFELGLSTQKLTIISFIRNGYSSSIKVGSGWGWKLWCAIL